ncbi:hypothetical protein BV25DRAFT_1909283 [Artomyces pyxidatus]|uniref:Uncharacterized protein n=1 Tax=Artomyces pyxidatus TaxID=48021 RepID=A0ACB8SP82_9AGAM|nr:hypothetical protein BV25DRAFT_1909283 [Artomyces pyxidatus]
MGNSASSPQHLDLPPRPPTSPSATSTPHTVHRSLRTKKKSLELPDLASLSLTPASSSLNSPSHSPHPHQRRPKASSPIPIPAQSAAANANAQHPYQSYPRPSQLPSTTQMPDVLAQQQPSTHIPLFPPAQRYRSTPAPSFARLPPITDHEPEPEPEPDHQPFVAELVTSTIPLGLRQAVRPAPDEPRDPVLVKVSWRGGGKNVLLARAGDENWKGRQSMEHDPEDPDTFSTYVPLLPGTHHIKFLVDDAWRVAHDLPTAVDDDGSLANYVNVPFSPSLPTHPASYAPSTHVPAPSDNKTLQAHQHQISFWSQTSDTAPSNPLLPPGADGPWTSVIPPALIAAAREEEAYLADGAQGTAPNIPPAPVLPRHLDKLILNVRIGTPTAIPKDRRMKERDGGGVRSRTRLAMTTSAGSEGGDSEHNTAGIPVTTASGTNVSGQVPQLPPPRGRSSVHGPTTIVGTGPTAAALALADDASVLPVPSHVVLHHLSTSAIRNGVLAVGNTTRYKKKFITTIYYKPT